MPYLQAAQQPQQPRSTPHKSTSPPISANRSTRITLTETYRIAITCRSKLGEEAGRADLELRRLVCHANMLDEIMVQLTQSEQEREVFFNNVIRAAHGPREQPSKLQWMDTIAEELEEEGGSSSTGGLDDEDDSPHVLNSKALRHKAKSPPPKPWSGYFDHNDDSSDEEIEDDAEVEDDEGSNEDDLALRRFPYQHRIPELTYEGDSDSEEEDLPLPRTTTFQLSYDEKQHSTTAGTSRISLKPSSFGDSLQLVVVVD